MAKGTTAEERAGAISVLPANWDEVDDVENAFNDFRENLNQSQTPGEVRAFELPMDDRGVIQTTKAQVRLGAWPIDAYSFDQLCELLTKEFMDPGAAKMAVRLLSSKPGQSGTQFNKIVVLKRRQNQSNGDVKETTASLMKAIQENNERLMVQFRAMLPQKPEADVATEIAKIIAISSQMNAPMMSMLSSLLPALVGRTPAAAADPFAGVSSIIDVAGKLADLRGGGGDASSGPDWLEAIRAIVPLAKPALEAIPAIAAQAAQNPRPPQPRPPVITRAQAEAAARAAAAPPGAPTAPGAAPTPAPGSQPSSTPAPQGQASMSDIPSGDAQVFAQIKPQIDQLVLMAAQGSDPVQAADLLFDNFIISLPDDYYSRIADLVSGPNFVKNATVFNPRVTEFADFFEKFRAQIAKRVEDEDAAAGSAPTDLSAAN